MSREITQTIYTSQELRMRHGIYTLIQHNASLSRPSKAVRFDLPTEDLHDTLSLVIAAFDNPVTTVYLGDRDGQQLLFYLNDTVVDANIRAKLPPKPGLSTILTTRTSPFLHTNLPPRHDKLYDHSLVNSKEGFSRRIRVSVTISSRPTEEEMAVRYLYYPGGRSTQPQITPIARIVRAEAGWQALVLGS